MKEIKHIYTALALHPVTQKCEEVGITGIDDIYRQIGANIFDIATRQIGNDSKRVYDIYVDDMGLLKRGNYISAYGDPDCILVGDILIAKHDLSGEMVSLTLDDIAYIKSYVNRELVNGKVLLILRPISYPSYT